MNTYHKTIRGKDTWIAESCMASTVPYHLKPNEYIEHVDIDDMSLLRSVGVWIQDGTTERQVPVPLSDSFDTANAKKVVLYFDYDTVSKSYAQQTLYKGWYYPPCDCCVEQWDLTEEEYDPDDERFRLDEIVKGYTVPIPNIRLTVSY